MILAHPSQLALGDCAQAVIRCSTCQELFACLCKHDSGAQPAGLPMVPLHQPRQMNDCNKIFLPLCRQLWSDLCLLDACAWDCAAPQLWPQ